MKSLTLFTLCLLGSVLLNAADQQLVNTQEITTPLTKPVDVVKGISLPEGFRVQLSASEPDVRQPIAMAFVTPEMASPGREVTIRVAGGKLLVATVVPMPFYDPENSRQKVAD